MQLEELKAYLKQARWFLHVGECQAREGILCEPTLRDIDVDRHGWDWLPTDASEEDPIHGDSLRLLADSLGRQLERRETVREVYKITLESLRKVGECHPLFMLGPHNILPAAKGAAAYAARMAATEIVVSREGFWCGLIPLYVEGFYPWGIYEGRGCGCVLGQSAKNCSLRSIDSRTTPISGVFTQTPITVAANDKCPEKNMLQHGSKVV